MLIPILRSRIEETNFLFGHRINGVGFGVFETVADTAREPQIFFIVRASGGFRQNMFDFKRDRHEVLRSPAVTAAIFCRLNYYIAEFGGNATHFKSPGEFINPRLTASAMP
jgi:hypothetical protein